MNNDVKELIKDSASTFLNVLRSRDSSSLNDRDSWIDRKS